MARHERSRWRIVYGSTLALVVCNGPVALFTFGLFLKPVSQEFGWNRGAMSAASASMVRSTSSTAIGPSLTMCCAAAMASWKRPK